MYLNFYGYYLIWALFINQPWQSFFNHYIRKNIVKYQEKYLNFYGYYSSSLLTPWRLIVMNDSIHRNSLILYSTMWRFGYRVGFFIFSFSRTICNWQNWRYTVKFSHKTVFHLLICSFLLHLLQKLADVQDFLGIPHMNLTSRQVKIHKGHLREHIKNWIDVNKTLNGTAYEKFLQLDYWRVVG